MWRLSSGKWPVRSASGGGRSLTTPTPLRGPLLVQRHLLLAPGWLPRSACDVLCDRRAHKALDGLASPGPDLARAPGVLPSVPAAPGRARVLRGHSPHPGSAVWSTRPVSLQVLRVTSWMRRGFLWSSCCSTGFFWTCENPRPPCPWGAHVLASHKRGPAGRPPSCVPSAGHVVSLIPGHHPPRRHKDQRTGGLRGRREPLLVKGVQRKRHVPPQLLWALKQGPWPAAPHPRPRHRQEMPGVCLPSVTRHCHLLQPGCWAGQPRLRPRNNWEISSLKPGFQRVRS